MNEPQPSVAEIEALLGAYALDAVDPDERRLVDAHLVDCPRCRAELAGHLEVASWMAGGGSRAPEGVWERIASAIDERPPALRLTSADLANARAAVPSPELPSSVPPSPQPPPAGSPAAPVVDLSARRGLRTRVLAGALAVAAAVILVLGIVVARQSQELDDRRGEIAAEMSRAAGQAMADPSATKVPLAAPTGGDAAATVVVLPDGHGFVMGTTLPPLPDDRTYQLWGIEGDRVISLGVLGNEPTVSAFPTGGVGFTTYALTEEAAGGVPQSANPPVAVGTV
jgi:anti-sigma factor RsiW